MADTRKNDALYARLEDLCRSAEQGMLGESCFLSPAELHFAREYLARSAKSGEFLEWGGYESAERRKIYILPEYALDARSYDELREYGFEGTVAAVKIVGSGYCRLCHRDFLGAVLGLGLERQAVGDIAFFDGERPWAIVICESSIADFIADELKKIGNDTVRAEKTEIDKNFSVPRQFVHISDTVASARVDCVVASLCSLSRDKARQSVLSGTVEVDYEREERPDRAVCAPCVISVRGYGKFRVNSVSEPTRKGRLRLDADKYV